MFLKISYPQMWSDDAPDVINNLKHEYIEVYVTPRGTASGPSLPEPAARHA